MLSIPQMDISESHALSLEDELAHWWVRTRYEALEQTLKGRRQLRVLEIGCGTAQNLKLLESSSVDINEMRGVDPNLGDTFHRLSPPSVVSADFPQAQGQFDWVIAMDVLEHIEDDQSALKQWGSYLASDGSLFISVPAFQSLWSYHDEALGHFRRYTRESLAEVAESSGFQVVKSFYLFSFLLIPVWLIRRLWNRKSDKGSDLSMPPRWMNFLLRAMGALEVKLGGFPFFGTSVVAVLRPKREGEA